MNAVLARRGLRISRVDRLIADFTDKTDPIEAAYGAGGRPFLINVPLAACRILPPSAFICATTEANPFVQALLDYARTGERRYSGSALEDFHASFQPQSAAEALGIPVQEASKDLSSHSAFGFVYPWSAQSPDRAERHLREMIERDNRQHGFSGRAQLGWKSWGPVHQEIGELEMERLVALYDAIKRDGYRRSDHDDGDIRGVVLFDGSDFRVVVASGQHRAAVLTALGIDKATVRVSAAIVRRADIEHWPNVVSGLFSQAQAAAVFQRVFTGRRP